MNKLIPFIALCLISMFIIEAKSDTIEKDASNRKIFKNYNMTWDDLKKFSNKARDDCSTGPMTNSNDLVNQAINTMYFGNCQSCCKFYYALAYTAATRITAKNTLYSYIGFAYQSLTITNSCDSGGFYWNMCYVL